MKNRMVARIAIILSIPFCMYGMYKNNDENNSAASSKKMNLSSCMRCKTACTKCREINRVNKHNYGPASDILVGGCPTCYHSIYLDQNKGKYFMRQTENTLSVSSSSKSSGSSERSQISQEDNYLESGVSQAHRQHANNLAMAAGISGALCLSSFFLKTNDFTLVAARWGLAGSAVTAALFARMSFLQARKDVCKFVDLKRR